MLAPFIALVLTAGELQADFAASDIPIVDHPPCDQIDGYDTRGAARREALQDAARLACRTGPPITPQEASDLLGSERFAFRADLDAGELVVAARPRQGAPGRSYGALSGPLDRVGDGIYATRFKLSHLNEAMLSFYLPPHLQSGSEPSTVERLHWRGPDAPSLAIITPELEGRIEYVTLYSDALRETRRLAIYTPPQHDRDAGGYPAVVIADGSEVEHLGYRIETYIAEGRIKPLVLIGLVSGAEGIVEEVEEPSHIIRNSDYLPGVVGPVERFEQHLTFAADEVLSFARDEYGVSKYRQDIAVNGRSSGGGFAFHAVMRRSDVFANALVHSPRATVPQDTPPAGPTSARFHIVAGRYETGFLSSARLADTELRAAGYDVRLTELSAGHTPEITEVTLAADLEGLFPGPAARSGSN